MENKHNQLETEVVTLTLDDDMVIDCAVVTVFEAVEQEYIALLPLNANEENEDGDVWIYRFIRDNSGNGEHDLQNIMDDEEYEIAADVFDEWLDTQEFLNLQNEE